MANNEKIKLSVYRYDPTRDAAPKCENYKIPYRKGVTVLGVLEYVYKRLDGSLTFGCECRAGYCGVCAVQVNKEPKLVCKTLACKEMIIEPLPNFPIVKDLVIDRSFYYEKIDRIKPFIQRVISPGSEPEKLKPEEFKMYKTTSRCVRCLCCQSICPVVTQAPQDYAGPAVMIELAKYTFDPRDKGARGITAYHEGIFNCINCSKCDKICPSHIPISGIIKKMREQAADAISV